MNAGIYREGRSAGALPLARTRLAGLTCAIAVLAAAAIVTPSALLVLACRSLDGARRAILEGGVLPMLAVLGVALVMPIILGVLGARFVRGRKVPPGLVSTLAALPFAVGLLGHRLGLAQVSAALVGESIDVDAKVRIMIAGVGESMWTDVVSGFVACTSAIVACVAASSGAASVDVARATRGAPRGKGLAVTAVVGAAWLAASIALATLRWKASGPVIVFPVVAVVVLLPFALLAAHGASGLAGAVPGETRLTLGGLLVAAACAALAMILFERSLGVLGLARALDAISGDGIDHAQRARILAEAVAGRRLETIALVLEGVLGAATFGAAMLPGLGAGRRPAVVGILVTMALAASLGLAAIMVEHAGAGMVRATVETKALDQLPSVARELPRRDGDRFPAAHAGLHLGSGGHLVTPSREADACAPQVPAQVTLHASRDATAGELSGLLRSNRCVDPEVVIVARHARDAALDRQLGAMSVYLQGFTAVSGLEVRATPARPGALVVRVIADDALAIDGERTAYPLAAGIRRAKAEALHFVFRPTDSIDRIVQTMTSVEAAVGPVSDVVFDLGVPPPPTAPPPGLAAEAPIASGGRLPPEVIRRILRQHERALRSCYEQGRKKDPALAGRLLLKLVIGESGAVTSVHDESDFPDREVSACVVHRVHGLLFPEPVGGSVTVSYPIVFAPAR